MEINILIEDEFKGRLVKRWLSMVAEQVLSAENTGNNVELGVLITTQERVQELNWTYRSKNEPTDVLSFYMIPEAGQKEKERFITPPDKISHLGEVVISYPQAVAKARDNKHTVKKEISILLIHGILHLLGYDHEKPGDEKRMKARESLILYSLHSNQG
jgi:probable rRNA maturation factor